MSATKPTAAEAFALAQAGFERAQAEQAPVRADLQKVVTQLDDVDAARTAIVNRVAGEDGEVSEQDVDALTKLDAREALHKGRKEKVEQAYKACAGATRAASEKLEEADIDVESSDLDADAENPPPATLGFAREMMQVVGNLQTRFHKLSERRHLDKSAEKYWYMHINCTPIGVLFGLSRSKFMEVPEEMNRQAVQDEHRLAHDLRNHRVVAMTARSLRENYVQEVADKQSELDAVLAQPMPPPSVVATLRGELAFKKQRIKDAEVRLERALAVLEAEETWVASQGVATDAEVIHFHRHHRDPGDHSVARRRFFAQTVSAGHAQGQCARG